MGDAESTHPLWLEVAIRSSHWIPCSPGRIGQRVPNYVAALVLASSLEWGMFYTSAESVLTNDQWVSLAQGHRCVPQALSTVVTGMGRLASFPSFTVT